MCIAEYNRERNRAIALGIWKPVRRRRQPSFDTFMPLKHPDPLDIAWAAGFLEGEGAFTLIHARYPRVKAVQVNREPLERLLRIFGGRMAGETILFVYDCLSERRKQQAQKLMAALQ